jgi:peptide/nickel transport system permease protein
MNKGPLANLRKTIRRFAKYPLGIFGVACLTFVLLVSILGQLFIPYGPFDLVGTSFEPPSMDHIMGTDDLGRDIFGGIIHGTMVSLYIGIVAMSLSFVIGVLLGSISGYSGGRIDEVLMRIVEIFQVLPSFVLALVIVSFFGLSLSNIIFAIALVSWPSTARLTRAQFLSFKEREFVLSAKALGVNTPSIIFLEIFPNAMSPVIVNGAVQIASSILTESGLSFLGLSDANVMSLGRMLGNAQHFLARSPWMCVFPGIFLALIVVSINLLADVLNEIVNPKLK